MIDQDRITELKDEIGDDDLALVLGMFIAEARREIARIGTGLDAVDHAKATHFLRSGALNVGLVGLARDADLAAMVQADARAGTAEILARALRQSTAALGMAEEDAA
ncbi:MAG: hypothetical protein WBA25_08295 [Jannaschia sp.]